MEDFTTHLPYYSILLVILLGAFLIGYFFGRRTKETIPVKTEQVKIPILSRLVPDTSKLNDTKSQVKKVEHIEIDDLSMPGPIRAFKTRERSGSLSRDAKMTIIEEKVDFSTMGRAETHEKDDFQKIVGIGPYVEEQLNDIRIYKFSQLAKMTDQDINGITQLIEFFPGRIHRDDWRSQAAALEAAKV
jgi:predicted flap endonuclease-1-like 5' DNA nuclease